MNKPTLYTVLSPALLHLYDVRNSIVVVIDVLRATSTIATALYNGAKEIIPVDSVERCIQLGKEMECITAGERDGQIAEDYNMATLPLNIHGSLYEGKTLVLTTTNGTKLLHMALAKGATEIITGSFLNLSCSVRSFDTGKKECDSCLCWLERQSEYGRYLICRCRCFKSISDSFEINCDSSRIAETSLRTRATESL